MKVTHQILGSRPSARFVPLAAFTLTEMMIAVAIFSLLVTGMVGVSVFGLAMYQVAETRLTASDGARIAVSHMTDEIRNSSGTYVGTLTNGIFTEITNGEPQSGSALLIYPTTNTSSYVVYFVNSSDQTFRRSTSTPIETTILAQQVTNLVVFTAEDFLGNVLTNNQDNRVIHACLEFCVPQGTVRDPGNYKMETSATRRSL